MKKLSFLIIFSLILPSFPAPAIAAEGFDPDYVMSDRDLTDTSVPEDFPQKFLVSNGAGIADMLFRDLDGTMKRPGTSFRTMVEFSA